MIPECQAGRAETPRRSVLALATHELREATRLTVGRLFLVQEGKPVPVERLEPLVPRDLLELLVSGTSREMDSENARVAAPGRRLDPRRAPSPLLGPAPDLLVVGRTLRLSGHA